MENEIWKDIEGFENLYQISNLGRVKSLERLVNNRWGNGKVIKERLLSTFNNGKGYLQVDLYKDGKRNRIQIHRLVANAFIPNPNNYPQVNHKDENPNNNCVENLEWCNQKYNSNYGTSKIRISTKLKGRINTITSKKVFQYSLDGKLIKVWPSTMECERYGYQQGNIASCCRGERITHKGFIWKYNE